VARRFFLHLYMLRIPILILLMLGIVLPSAFGSPMLHGLADLEPNQVLLVSLGAFLLLSTAMTCAFLVLLYGSERADGKRLPMVASLAAVSLPQRLPLSGWIVGTLYVAGNFLYLRFLYAVLQTMKAAHPDPDGVSVSFFIRAALGALLGTAVIIAIFVLNLVISEPRQCPQIEVFALPITYLFRDSNWLTRIIKKLSNARPAAKLRGSPWVMLGRRAGLFLVRVLGPGYGQFDAKGQPTELNPGHIFAGMLMLACVALYLIAGVGEHSRLYTDAPFGPARPYDAVLLQVILLLLLTCWLLSGLSFYFDRFRVPMLIPIAAGLFLTSHFGSSDHAFHTVDSKPNAALALAKPEASFAASPDHVIVVAAAGGGIQAAAWTSQVLCGLRQEIGPDFDRDVLAISGVSGGSVGVMFYLRCRESPERDATAATTATNSSLEAIAWGLAHPDLRHALLPIQALWWKGDDRGWALERALRKNAQFSPPDRPLTSQSAVEQWPVLLFNSTEVRTGDPLVFTNSNFPGDVPDEQENHRLHGFHKVYVGRDVNLETAVRMSAAFPYVSPAARADTPWNAEHLVDGGYFDNSGLFSLGEWLKEAAPNTKGERGQPDRQHPSKKILAIRIDAFPDSDWDGPADDPKSWAYQFVAPVDAILHVRSEGQLVRDTTEGADLITVLTGRGYEASGVTARYIPAVVTNASNPSVSCPADPPLTWHLTELEKLCIQQSWKNIKADLLTQVRKFLAEPVSPPAATATPGEVHSERLEKGLYVHKMVKR
jgi:predicted acylesterase/phospholipase RssA